MIDREKVKKGLDLCLTGEASVCEDCPYDAECKEAKGIGPSPLRRDALELLKEPETRITVDANGIRTDRVAHWKGFTVLMFCGIENDGKPIYRPRPIYICSKCKRRTVIKTPYCPQCGAMMDGVKQE